MNKLMVSMALIAGIANADIYKEEYRIEVKGINLNKVQVEIDCSDYEIIDKFFYKEKRYNGNSKANEFYEKACRESKKKVIHQVSSLVRMANNEHLRVGLKNTKFSNLTLEGLNVEFEFAGKSSFLGSNTVISFPVVSVQKNTELYYNTVVQTARGTRMVRVDHTYYGKALIKEYSVDENNLPKVLKFEKIPTYNPKTFTNTYNIDNLKECIDGKIWIKKYGSTAGDKCDWIEFNKKGD